MSEPRETVWEKDEHHVPPAAASLTTFVVLAVLTCAALFVGFSNNLGPWKLPANLLVAGVEAAVLSLFFMDLRNGDKLTWLCAGAGVFWVGLMFLFILTDYLTRHLAAY